MGGEWDAVHLDDICDDITVGHVGLMAGEYLERGVPFLRSLNVRPFGFEMDDIKYISTEFHAKLKKSALKPGDVVIVRTGRPGACAVIPGWLEDANCSDLIVIRPGRRVRPDYVAYVVNTAAGQHIFAHTVGAVQQHFNVGSARTIRIGLPSLHEQDRMLNLLRGLDDKIEMNWRMAETLQSVARALFKSWFIDFDPVHARAEGHPSGLSNNVAALFPDSFGDDGLPKGWSKHSISGLGQFLNGLALQKYPAGDDEPSLPVIKIAELRTGPTPKSDRASASVPSDYVIQDGDHLFSWSGSLMHCRWSYGVGALNQHLFKVTARSCPSWFLYQAVEHFLPEFRSIASDKAVTMGHIQRRHLDEARIAVPPAAVMKAADDMLGPMHHRVLTLALHCRTLADLRDTLLPKLISGELRIADAEQRVAAA